MVHLQGLFFWRTGILQAAPKTFSVLLLPSEDIFQDIAVQDEALTFIFFLPSRGKWKMKVFSFLQNAYVRGRTCLSSPLHWPLLLVRSIGETTFDSFLILSGMPVASESCCFGLLELADDVRAGWRGEGKRVSSCPFSSDKWWSSNSGLFGVTLY